ncbi:MAG: DUF6273 domain-containing protein [Lachnospiraceae bacterium]|nr:DUF6273 domain-containing protein [Lachnospiraceae bacterium]
MKQRSNHIRKILPVALSMSCMFANCYAVNAAESQAETAAVSTFSVGAAVRDITPTDEMLPLERAPRVTMTGVLDPLSVRAIALSDADTTTLIVASETGRSFGPQFAQALSEHTGIPLDNIILTSTHTHAAPEITEEIDMDFEEGAEDVTNLQLWAKFALQQVLDAADEALANLEPASVGIDYSESYINVNRNSVYTKVNEDGTTSEERNLGWNPTGPSDKTVAAIRFNNADGDPIAFIINYAVHGTVMHANTCMEDGTTAISADIPGIVSGYLEDNYEGAVAMWLSGAAGDQNPIIQNDLYSPNYETGEFDEIFGADYDILTFLSQIHYADIERALDSIDEYTSDVDLVCEYTESTIPATEGGDYNISLQMLRIGDIGLACFPGELFSTTGVNMKENALLEDTIIVNHAWQRDTQNNGYHADDWTIENGGFGQRQAKFLPGYLDDALITLMNDFYMETGAWLYNEDGTATYSTTGEVTIVGLDGKAGTADDNQVVNPAGTALLTDVTPEYDEDGKVYITIDSDLKLTAGEDGKIGTTDDVVTFGSYMQSEHVDDGNTAPLSWQILDIKDGKATLITESIVDGVQFNLSDADGNDWSTSNLRSWMNSNGGQNLQGDTTGFYDAAFTEEEKAKIVLTDVSMNSDSSFIAYNRLVKNASSSEDYWDYYTTTGTDTQDYVYALSGEEVFEYFGLSTVATLEELGHNPLYYTDGYTGATGYAVYVGVNTNGGGNGTTYIGYADSWTRSQGAVDETGETSCGVFLGSVGSLNVGRSVTRGYGARPVINVTLN